MELELNRVVPIIELVFTVYMERELIELLTEFTKSNPAALHVKKKSHLQL